MRQVSLERNLKYPIILSSSRRRKTNQRAQLMAGAIGLRTRNTKTSGRVTYHLMSFCMLTVVKWITFRKEVA